MILNISWIVESVYMDFLHIGSLLAECKENLLALISQLSHLINH